MASLDAEVPIKLKKLRFNKSKKTAAILCKNA